MTSMLVTMHPIWQSGAVVLAAAIISALVLQVLVHRVLPAALRREHTELGAAIFSVIGVTYAVLLAFVAMTAWEQYTAAQALARREANLIGSLYGASHGIAEPAGAAMRADLVAYLAHVIDVEWPAQIAGHPIPAAEPLLGHLDGMVMAFQPNGAGESNVHAVLIRGLTEVATVRRDRRLATGGTIPDLVWIVLLSGGALMVSFSFILGAPKLSVHLLMTAALVASGVLVLLLVLGLSSPFQGEVTIPPDAYRDVLSEIRAAP